MLKQLLTFMLIATFSFGANATPPTTETEQYKVVFQLTSDNPQTWKVLLNNLNNTLADLGDNTEIEVVTHSDGIAFLTLEKNTETAEIEALVKRGVRFLACENTMQKKDVQQSDLNPFAQIISSGIAHIIKRQNQGWAYIRMAD